MRDEIVGQIEAGICSSNNVGENTDLFLEFESAGGQLVDVLNQLREFGQTDITTIKGNKSMNCICVRIKIPSILFIY